MYTRAINVSASKSSQTVQTTFESFHMGALVGIYWYMWGKCLGTPSLNT